jgi:hypothetical protein
MTGKRGYCELHGLMTFDDTGGSVILSEGRSVNRLVRIAYTNTLKNISNRTQKNNRVMSRNP